MVSVGVFVGLLFCFEWKVDVLEWDLIDSLFLVYIGSYLVYMLCRVESIMGEEDWCKYDLVYVS